MSTRTRFTLDELQKNSFYQMPRFLLTEEFKGLSNDARVLYTLMKERHELSLKNNWLNKQGEVYLLFSRDAMEQDLNVSKPTVIKCINELKRFGLMEEERLGLGRMNQIYLLVVEATVKQPEPTENLEENRDNIQTSKKITSDHEVSSTLDNQFFYPELEYFKYNNTNQYKDQSSQSQSVPIETTEPTTKQQPDRTDPIKTQKKEPDASPIRHRLDAKIGSKQKNSIDDYTTTLQLLKDNIEYNFWKNEKSSYIEQIDEFLLIMLDTILTRSPNIRISGEEKPRSLVKSALLKINSMDLEYVLNKFNSQRQKITNKASYILKCLYTCKMEMNSHYSNIVSVNGY